MSMRQVNDLSKLYVEAVYGGVKKKSTDMVVTNADKKANTPAYQNLKKGVKGYKAADHMDEGHSADTKGKKNCGCGQDPCVTYGKQDKKSMKEEKKAKKDYDGDGKIESGKDEYFGSKDKAIKKAMGKKVATEELSNWRDELVEDNLIEIVDSEEEDENYGAKKKIDVKKGIKNKVNINPNLPEAVEEMGAELIEVKVEKKKKTEFSSKAKGHDCASKVKHESYGVGQCMKEEHDLDEDGNVTHYDVKFSNRIIRNVPASSLEVLEGMYHEHVIRDEGTETAENYQAMRNPEKEEKKDTRSAREKRMADPKKGINSPAFKEFMRQQGM